VKGFLPFTTLQRPFLKNELRKACQELNEPKIFQLVEELQKMNPTLNIIKDFYKLNGEWELDFTTASEGEVPRNNNNNNNKQGNADEVKTYQSIDANTGVIYNIIDRGLPEKGLKIAVGAEPTRPNRVALDFRTIEAYNNKFPKKVVLRFPPRNFFRTIFKAQQFLKNEPFSETEFKEIGHFDVLFLDDDLRIQRNSEGNLFINSRIA